MKYGETKGKVVWDGKEMESDERDYVSAGVLRDLKGPCIISFSFFSILGLLLKPERKKMENKFFEYYF